MRLLLSASRGITDVEKLYIQVPRDWVPITEPSELLWGGPCANKTKRLCLLLLKEKGAGPESDRPELGKLISEREMARRVGSKVAVTADGEPGFSSDWLVFFLTGTAAHS